MVFNLCLMYLGVSENSVPLNPMVLLIIIPMTNGYFIGNINPTFSDKPICVFECVFFFDTMAWDDLNKTNWPWSGVWS